ncbi:MAG: hypothetical protein ACE5PM_09010 [Candidatus Hydrothermarchaeales archaeon]
MDEKGQITLEAILIIGLFILIFVGISMPMAFRAYDSTTDTSSILEAQDNLDAVVGTIEMVVAGGPGSVRTITVRSTIANWGIAAYDADNPNGDTLTYWLRWSSADAVPSEVITNTGNNTWGGISVASIDGVSGGGTPSEFLFQADDGVGTWKIKVTHNATIYPSVLSINDNLIDGDIIDIVLTD